MKYRYSNDPDQYFMILIEKCNMCNDGKTGSDQTGSAEESVQLKME